MDTTKLIAFAFAASLLATPAAADGYATNFTDIPPAPGGNCHYIVVHADQWHPDNPGPDRWFAWVVPTNGTTDQLAGSFLTAKANSSMFGIWGSGNNPCGGANITWNTFD